MTFTTRKLTLNGRQFRRTEAYDNGKLCRVYFERFVPETSVRRGFGKWNDRHACWRLVSTRHIKLLSKLNCL